MTRPRRAAFAGILLAIGGAGFAGCRSSEGQAGLEGRPFARVELTYEGCSCFEEVRQLRLISWRLFGALPEIDEERQIVRVAIAEPKPLPLREFAAAVDGTHAVTRGLRLEVKAWVRKEQAVLQGTGQTIAIEGDSREGAEARWCRLRAMHWEDGTRFRMAFCN